MYIVRYRFLKYLRFLTAAISIQSCYRGYKVRKSISFVKKKRCPDCSAILNALVPEIRALKLEVYEIVKQQKKSQELNEKYEKAFRYLFEQVGQLTNHS